jgi:hypothetical protein
MTKPFVTDYKLPVRVRADQNVWRHGTHAETTCSALFLAWRLPTEHNYSSTL